jgi:hypothetical protein
MKKAAYNRPAMIAKGISELMAFNSFFCEAMPSLTFSALMTPLLFS